MKSMKKLTNRCLQKQRVIGRVHSLLKCAPSSTFNPKQWKNYIDICIFFIIANSGIGFTSKENCKRLAAAYGLPVNYWKKENDFNWLASKCAYNLQQYPEFEFVYRSIKNKTTQIKLCIIGNYSLEQNCSVDFFQMDGLNILVSV